MCVNESKVPVCICHILSRFYRHNTKIRINKRKYFQNWNKTLKANAIGTTIDLPFSESCKNIFFSFVFQHFAHFHCSFYTQNSQSKHNELTKMKFSHLDFALSRINIVIIILKHFQPSIWLFFNFELSFQCNFEFNECFSMPFAIFHLVNGIYIVNWFLSTLKYFLDL